MRIGFVLFPGLTQLDLTAPYEVFCRVPELEVQLLAHALEPVKSDRGLTLVPDRTLAESDALDIVCVPGGPGQIDVMEDDILLGFLRRQDAESESITAAVGRLLADRAERRLRASERAAARL